MIQSTMIQSTKAREAFKKEYNSGNYEAALKIALLQMPHHMHCRRPDDGDCTCVPPHSTEWEGYIKDCVKKLHNKS